LLFTPKRKRLVTHKKKVKIKKDDKRVDEEYIRDCNYNAHNIARIRWFFKQLRWNHHLEVIQLLTLGFSYNIQDLVDMYNTKEQSEENEMKVVYRNGVGGQNSAT